MAMQPQVTGELTVEETLQRWPQTARVFIARRMACVGCPIAPFETLDEAGAIYRLDGETFLHELQESAAASSDEP